MHWLHQSVRFKSQSVQGFLYLPKYLLEPTSFFQRQSVLSLTKNVLRKTEATYFPVLALYTKPMARRSGNLLNHKGWTDPTLASLPLRRHPCNAPAVMQGRRACLTSRNPKPGSCCPLLLIQNNCVAINASRGRVSLKRHVATRANHIAPLLAGHRRNHSAHVKGSFMHCVAEFAHERLTSLEDIFSTCVNARTLDAGQNNGYVVDAKLHSLQSREYSKLFIQAY